MPQPPKGRDENPYGLSAKFRNRLPKSGKADKCALELAALFDCLEDNDMDRGQCSQYVEAMDGCMKIESMRKKPSTNYHLIRMMRNRYRIPPGMW